MSCKNCMVEELRFEMKLEGEQNTSIISDVIDHLSRRQLIVEANDNVLVIKESGVRDFIDFCDDHMNPELVSFQLNNQGFRPLTEVHSIIEKQWIDGVIHNKWVTCYFQPIVTQERKVFAYELLARFQKEDGSFIYPNEVFPAAKIRGRLYALDKLCRMTAVRHAASLKVKAFINFIPTSIYAPEHCLKSTVHLAKLLGADPGKFVFEVVETEQVDDINHLKSILDYYREKGFQYALNDVGEGFSTIELLSDLMPQYMKLDMKYVQGITSDPDKQQVAKRFLDAALKIDAIPLAEGIETLEDFEWLKQAGYQLFQGYLFGKPSPTPEVPDDIN